jgi:hypothetical protein
MRVETPPASIF